MRKLLLIPCILLLGGCSLFGDRTHYDPAMDQGVSDLYNASIEELNNLYDPEKAANDPLYKDDYEMGKMSLKSIKSALDLLFKAQKKADKE